MNSISDMFLFYSPYLLIISLGYCSRRCNYFSASTADALGQYFIKFPMPATCFLLIAKFPLEKVSVFAYFAMIFATVMATVFVACFVLGRYLGKNKADAVAMATLAACPSISTIGLPLIIASPGGADLVDIWSVAIVIELTMIALIIAPLNDLTSGHQVRSIRGQLIRSFKSPAVVASLAGFIVASYGLAVPHVVVEYFQEIMVGLTAVVMLAVGGKFNFSFMIRPSIAELAVVVMKSIVMPLLALLLCFIFHIDASTVFVLVVLSACPSSGLAPVLTNKSRFGAISASQTLVGSLFLSLLSMPFFMYHVV